MQNISSENIGHQLERLAHALAPAIALAYTAGLALGAWVHQMNDTLAAAYVRALGLEQAAPQVSATPTIEPIQADATPTAQVASVELAALTVPQLRTLARAQLGSATRISGRRIAQAKRADLLLALAG